MVLLRLLANILFYSALGLIVYWALTKDISALWLAIIFAIISALLLVYTTDSRRSRRHNDIDIYDRWDFWFLTELLEIPLRLLIWLFKSLWRIFD